MNERVLARPRARRRRWMLAPLALLLLAAAASLGSAGRGLYTKGPLGLAERAAVALWSGW